MIRQIYFSLDYANRIVYGSCTTFYSKAFSQGTCDLVEHYLYNLYTY
jgi:hypothetical protein